MKLDRGLVAAMLVPGAALGVWLALGGALLWASFDQGQRATVRTALAPLLASHGMLLVVWWMAAVALAAWAAHRLHAAHVAAPMRLADATRAMAADPAAPDVAVAGGAPTRAVAGAINALAGQRRALEQEMTRRVAEASGAVVEQRDQLGALMAELDQSVVVCNMEGRILLYNERARQLVRRLSRAPGAAGAELIGLGRSIHGVIDPALIAHAVETVERRIVRGEGAASPAARFVTGTPAGHLLRVSMAPFRPAEAGGPTLAGFVLLLDDVTDEHEAEARRDRQVLDLTEGSRAALANVQAALDVLEYPDLDAEGRERLHAVVRDEVAAMGARLAAFAESQPEGAMARWPLQDMLGADLLAAAGRRIEADLGRSVTLEAGEPGLWLRVDGFALIEALAFLAARLAAVAGSVAMRLRLAAADGRAHLDLAWSGDDVGPEALTAWRSQPMQTGAGRSSLSVGEIAERHGGEVWIQHDDGGGGARFRFLLPLALSEPAVTAPAIAGERPEYYDFDLFVGGAGGAFDNRSLLEIAYTVFDTETTGLDPAQGDEIVQIGAVRIVNGRLLRAERFDQLVDPGRSIPEASTLIHGIGPEHVRGKPSIVEVLPALRAFAGDTVLVGHNVAFDLRFLKLKEASSGVRFDQPVLDTLLLSSVVHPNEESHGLEAIAGRLGVTVSVRHSALGDALTTAEVFLRLLPLLGQRRIHTLSHALGASRDSYYARLRY